MIALFLLCSLCEAKRPSIFSSKAYDAAYRDLETQKEATDKKLHEYRTEASTVKKNQKAELIKKVQELPHEAEQYVEAVLEDAAEKLARTKDLKDSVSLKREGQKYIQNIKADATRLITVINKHADRRA